MQDEHLRVWRDSEDLKGGRKAHEQVEQEIGNHDKLLLVLSEASMQSGWVKTEIRHPGSANGKKKRVLFPISLVPFETLKKWKCFDPDAGEDMACEIREYYIPDFTNWKDHDSFEAAFKRLLNDLKAKSAEAK